MDQLEERVERLAGGPVAELLVTVQGLRCALAVVDRELRDLAARGGCWRRQGVTGKVRRIAGLEAPLMGREAELVALTEAIERLQAGVSGIVTIVGEAGAGESWRRQRRPSKQPANRSR
jgi:hypothetical protein